MSENIEEKPQITDRRRFARSGSTLDIKAPQSLPADPSDAFVQEIADTLHGKKYVPLEGEIAFSPSSIPTKTPGMDFPTAIQQVIKGNRVTRLEWENPETWLMMFYWGQINPKVSSGKYLSIHNADGSVHPLYISDGDLLADDWVVVV